MTPRFIVFSALGAAVLMSPATALAQERPQAIVDPSAVDDDYRVQGEYVGEVMSRQAGRWLVRRYGLQAAAQGGGEFIGVLYPGGLPGGGWDRSERLFLAGASADGQALLEGDGVSVVVDGSVARLASATRQLVGELRKVIRRSRTMGLRPPAGAVVLFDGSSTERLVNGRISPEGLLMEGPGRQDVLFQEPYGDFTLHLEFRTSYMPHARGQGRSNSGVYIHSRYEVQILDSFALEGAFNECAALYRQRPPDVHMCLPPLVWQTYDIDFTAPRFDASGNKSAGARITVRHNGVAVHDNIELTAKTGAGRSEGPEPLQTKLQNHSDPIRFRNIWVVPRDREPLLAGSGRITRRPAAGDSRAGVVAHAFAPPAAQPWYILPGQSAAQYAFPRGGSGPFPGAAWNAGLRPRPGGLPRRGSAGYWLD